jgi:hypothetical protein
MYLGGSGTGRLAQLALAPLMLLALLALWLGAPTSARAATAPQIPASWADQVTSTGATLRAEINAEGETTTFHVEYISEAAYQANLQAIPPREGFFGASRAPKSTETGIGKGTTPLTSSQQVSGLTPVTAYRYRPVATNTGGTTVGPEHSFVTQETGVVFHLLDGRAWEMVSPADKGGGAIAKPESLFGGGDFQAAAGGGAVTYGSSTSFGATVGAPPSSQYLSGRGEGGWSTANVSAPLDSAAYGDHPDGTPYRVFSSDLSEALLFGGLPCRGGLPGCPQPNPVLPGSGAPPGYMAYYLRDAGGSYVSLLDASDLSHTAVSPEDFEVAFAAATPDLSHVVLSSCAKLTEDAKEVLAPGGCVGQNLYEWSAGTLKAIDLLPGDTETTPGAILAAPLGAVSEDGNRVYMYELEDGPLYLREGAQSKAIAGTTGTPVAFQAASGSGRYAFYTKAGHLYRWDAESEASTDLTPSGGVQGVLGVSADGTYAYFQDGAGLEQWHIDPAEAETTTTVAAGANAAAPGDYPPATGTARVSADGRHLAFLSTEELSGYDNDGFTELFLYGPPVGGGASRLVCASCDPTLERASGAATIPGAVANGSTRAYKPRVLSTDGQRVFFDSAQKLALQDTNARPDVYEWEAQGSGDCQRSPGCLGLVSSGRTSEGARFIDASASGNDVYFLTDGALVEEDPGSIDLYDARVGGGFPQGIDPIPCIGDACQYLPSPPEDPTPGTLVPTGGNPRLRVFHEQPKHRHEKRHNKKHRRKHHRRHDGNRHRGGERHGGGRR